MEFERAVWMAETWDEMMALVTVGMKVEHWVG